ASDIQFVVDETDQVTRSLRQATTQLQEGMTKSRMVPFSQTADRLPRAIRDISLKLDKQAKLKVEGGDVLIDKMILEHLNSPMTHLVNNAITHGIESPQERMAKGKPALGKISVGAFLQGNQTVITVSDDGAGIDANLIKLKAIEKGLISDREAQNLSTQEVYEILLHPGFTTKDQADDFSGRGVGLDVVRTSLIDVRGTVTIDSVLGKGSTFTLRLPLTLTICKALCCVSNHARIGFSMDGVEDMKDFRASEMQIDREGRRCVFWQNTLLPFQPLSELLSYNRQLSRGSFYTGKQEEDSFSIVILRGGNNLLAVQVDQVIGELEIVIKQIEGPIPKTAGIAGATVLGDGTVMPI
ncbi:MAG: chemotaxis protein CheA, partial [Microcystis panniformis]